MATEGEKRNLIYVVDDEAAQREILARVLEGASWAVESFARAADVLRAIELNPPEVVVTDFQMPGMDGIALLEEIRKLQEDLPVIVITAYASIELAVQAMKEGAYDFVTKPLDFDALEERIAKALETARLRRENARLRHAVSRLQHDKVPEPVAASSAMRRVLEVARQIADTDIPVLITGESGTGKEVLAQYLQSCSGRASKPYVKLNCAALPEELVSSELFGHEKGAFTGAIVRREGRFERAHGGTLLLDEIGDLTLPIQAKLLRVLEEKVMERLGGTRPVPIDVRFLFATHQPLAELVKVGKFREDLYYRINAFPLNIPPLRERQEDIAPLAMNFLEQNYARRSRGPRSLDPAAVKLLCAYHWPGNVRELRHCLERAAIMCREEVLQAEHLTLPWLSPLPAGGARPRGGLAEMERNKILETLTESNWDVREAANRLGIGRSTLYEKIRRYGLQRDKS